MNTEMKHTPTPWRQHLNWKDQVGTGETGSFDLVAECVSAEDAEFIILAANSYHSDQAKIKALTEALEAVSRRHPGMGGIGDIARAALSLAKS